MAREHLGSSHLVQPIHSIHEINTTKNVLNQDRVCSIQVAVFCVSVSIQLTRSSGVICGYGYGHVHGYGYVIMVVFPTNVMTHFTTMTSQWETNTWARGLRSRSLLNNKHAHHASYPNHSYPHPEKKNPTTR